MLSDEELLKVKQNFGLTLDPVYAAAMAMFDALERLRADNAALREEVQRLTVRENRP